jgi:HEPN domain-containing protein
MLRRPTDETDPKDWFLFASDRLQGADRLWAADGLTMAGIELLQEAAERYLKGYLIAKGWRLERTHDLKKLMDEAARFELQFKRFDRFAVELAADFFAQHYPGGDLTDVGRNYEGLRQQAGEMVALIRQGLPAYF